MSNKNNCLWNDPALRFVSFTPGFKFQNQKKTETVSNNCLETNAEPLM